MMPYIRYNATDALVAANWLVNNVTGTSGAKLAKNACIYGRSLSTIVSVCNGNARNRTVTPGEVQRGIEQLQKDYGGYGQHLRKLFDPNRREW